MTVTTVTTAAPPSAPSSTGPPAPRVLHVVLSLNPGGAERLVIDLSRRSRPEFSPAVCCLDERGTWAAELDAAGIPVFVLGRAPGFQPGLGRRIARLARDIGATTLHCHQYSPFVYGCLAKLVLPSLHVVFTEHGRLAGATISRKRKLANRILGRFPGRFFAVCAELRRFLVAEGFPPGRLEILYNGIEPGAPVNATTRERARATLALGPDEFVVGSVGRLDPVKDFATLISAFAATGWNSRLVIVGDGPERDSLAQAARAAGIVDRVIFTGARSDVRELMPAFDVYANSSTYEGVSLTIIEAMAAALPVVATCVGGTPEVVEDRRNGRLVPPGDPAALAAVLVELRGAPRQATELGVAGRRTVEERFRFDFMREAYANAYRTGVKT